MKLSESVEMIVNDESIALEGFYDRLFEKYPEFKDYFAETSLQRQTAMLTMALVGVKQYPVLRTPAHAYLQVLGSKHHRWGIPKDLYPKFIEILIEQIAEFHGDQWNEDLAKQWNNALTLAVATMHEGYQE
jgi:hemoglobin-like flavoprotein